MVATLPAPAVTVVVGPPLVDLLFDQPAATDANLVFGANYIAPRDDVTVQATLPLPVVTIKFIPPARAELLAQLPGLTVQSLVLRPSVPLNVGASAGASLPGVVFTGEVRYASHTQRPTVVGLRTSGRWRSRRRTARSRASRMQLRRPQAGIRSGGARLPRLKASIIGYPRSWPRCLRSIERASNRLGPSTT